MARVEADTIPSRDDLRWTTARNTHIIGPMHLSTEMICSQPEHSTSFSVRCIA